MFNVQHTITKFIPLHGREGIPFTDMLRCPS